LYNTTPAISIGWIHVMIKDSTSNRKLQTPSRFQIFQDSLDLAELEQQDSEIDKQITNKTNYLLTKSAKLLGKNQQLIATSQELIELSKQRIYLGK
jgi:hypothetical protein